MEKIFFNKLFWIIIIFVGFSFYFLSFSENLSSITGKTSLIRLNWDEAVTKIISQDCLSLDIMGGGRPVNENEFVTDKFKVSEADSLLSIETQNNNKCWVVVKNYNNRSKTGKVVYETIRNDVNEIFVKNLDL